MSKMLRIFIVLLTQVPFSERDVIVIRTEMARAKEFSVLFYLFLIYFYCEILNLNYFEAF